MKPLWPPKMHVKFHHTTTANYVWNNKDIIGRIYKGLYLAHCNRETARYEIYNHVKDLKIVERLLGLQNILLAWTLVLITPFNCSSPYTKTNQLKCFLYVL